MTRQQIEEINKLAKSFAKKFVEENPNLVSLPKEKKRKLQNDISTLLTGFGGLWIKN
jgi:hypothetical protein